MDAATGAAMAATMATVGEPAASDRPTVSADAAGADAGATTVEVGRVREVAGDVMSAPAATAGARRERIMSTAMTPSAAMASKMITKSQGKPSEVVVEFFARSAGR